MNVREYIKSGVIESYVLGIATEAERQEFEQMCAAYPEVVEARDAFERSLEAEVMQDVMQPPAYVKDKVWLEIKPAVTEGGFMNTEDETPVRRMNPWKWLAAASLILLAGATYWAYSTNEKYNDLVARQASTEQQLQQATAQLEAGRNPFEGLKVVSLGGTDVAPKAQTTIFWDTTRTNDVYMVVNNLPQTPTEKQYQLWALLDGKPIDLGVFDVNVQQKPLLIKMKNVQNAQAFAITLEAKGGKPAPEGPMYVIGNL